MKVLITGITGFVGSHLTEFLLDKKDIEIHGIYRWRSRRENIAHLLDKIHLHEADLMDLSSLLDIMKKVKPERIFHLAAQSYVQASWKIPTETLLVNTVGTSNLLESVRISNINPLIQFACSSEEYGEVLDDEIPIKETNALRPLSPYAVSKVATDFLGYQYYKSYGIKIVRTRGFNHTGPRRGEVFVSSNFAKQISEIERGTRPPVIYVGNLDAVRDFTDVRDMVHGYWLALEKGTPGDVYNICSGKGMSIKSLLDHYLSICTKKIEVKKDPERMRPSDVMVLIGDCTKFKDKTGWKPRISVEKTFGDTLDYWRNR